MSHPIKNMPAGYKVKDVRKFAPKKFDCVIVANYPIILLLSTYAIMRRMESDMTDEYTTAIFRIKWKP